MDIINWLFIRLMVTITMIGLMYLGIKLVPVVKSEKARGLIWGYIIGEMIISMGVWFI